MKNKDLIAILERLSPEAEIIVAVSDISTGHHLSDTYDVGYALNSKGELRLKVAVETDNAQR